MKAVAACYLAGAEALQVVLRREGRDVALQVPRSLLPALAGMPVSALQTITIADGGMAVEVAGVRISIADLLEWAKSPLWSDFARQGGLTVTPARQAAARANGKLGGRPKGRAR